MEEIFKQYSTPIIIVIVVLALLLIFGILLNQNGGPIMQNFQNLITSFFQEANKKFTH